MASQSILTQVSAITLSLANKAIPPWPNPEQSIDNTLDGIRIGRKTYWSKRGPAYEAWKIFDESIGQTLTTRKDEMYAGLSKAGAPHDWLCFMVGRAKTKACPYIVIVCKEFSVRERIMNIIKKSDWWPAQLRRYPGFGRFSLLRRAPRHLGSAGVDDHVWAPLSGLNAMLFSTPVFAYHYHSASDKATSKRLATLGGIVYLDYRPYALTVAHAFEELHDNAESDTELSSLDEDLWEDPLDDSEDDDVDEDINPILSPQSSITPTGARSTGIQASNLVDGPSIMLGTLAYRSTPISDDGTDWALVELSESTILQMEMRKASAKSDVTLKDFYDTNLPFPEDVATRYQDMEQVFVTGSDGRLIRGTFHAHKSLVCLAGSAKYLSFHTVSLNEDLIPGDCGKWIFDSQGNWYGHVVASIPGLRVIYIDLASDIKNSIGHILNFRSFDLSCSKFFTRVFQEPRITNRSRPNAIRRFGFDSNLNSTRNTEISESMFDLLNSDSTLASSTSLWDKRQAAMVLHSPMNSKTSQDYRAALKYASGRIVRLILGYGKDISRLAIVQACACGYEQVVQLLLNRGVATQNDSVKAASGNGHKRVVQILLDKGVPAGSDAVEAASEGGHGRIVELLLARGAIANKSAVKKAAARGHETTVQMLLDKGVPAGRDAVEAASEGGHERVVELLLARGIPVDHLAVKKASESGHERVVELLLASGVVADEYAVEAASEHGHERTVLLLLDSGVAARSKAIEVATRRGHEQMVRLLLGRGVVARSEVLSIALECGREQIAELLLREGVPPDDETLLTASKYGHKRMVRLLLDAGMQPNERIIRYARAYGHHNIVQMLHANGG